MSDNCKGNNLINRFFDNLIRLRINILHQEINAYQFFGYTGFILGTILGYGLIYYTGLSFMVFTILSISAIITFFSLAMIIKILSGEEQHTFYHHKIAVLLVSTLVLRLLNQPILVYLDIMVLGIGMFLSLGRIGCLMVGCCHGRPNTWGARYGINHVADGFPSYLANIRLFPVQALESVMVLLVVSIGIFMVFLDLPPGQVFAFYIIASGLVRFCLEFLRGDMDRSYLFGFSEAQWTSLTLMILVMFIELSGFTTFNPVHASLAAINLLLMIYFYINGRYNKGIFLLQAGHVLELMRIIQDMDRAVFYQKGGRTKTESEQVPISSTSLGLQISSGQIRNRQFLINHFAICHRENHISLKTVHRLGKIIKSFMYPESALQIRQGNANTFHLLFHIK